MRLLILSGLLILGSCGNQEEKNYYNSQDAAISHESSDESSNQENNYGGEREPLEKAMEFSFPVKTVGDVKNFPNQMSQKFYKVFEQRNKNLKTLNYETYEKGARELLIKGKHILLDEFDSQNILSLIQSANDLSKLTIEADTLIINAPVNLHQTNVKINAREIIFGAGAFINTSPKNLSYRAEQFKDGVNGLPGGDIEIAAQTINLDDHKHGYILISNGGRGQDGGLGLDGARGTNAYLEKVPNYYRYDSERCSSVGDRGAGGHHKLFRKGRRSGNGANAKAGGKPGEGGMPGNIIVSHASLVKASQQLGGKAGEADTTRIGGAPGEPVQTCKLEKKCSRKPKISKCVNAVKGIDATPKSALKAFQEDKKAIISNGEWMTNSIVENNLNYLKELYFQGHIEQTLMEKYKLESLIEATKNQSPRLTLIKSELQSIEYQLAARLDYYGNPAGWTPSLNFNLNFRGFKNEVARSLRILFFTRLLQNKLTDHDSAVAGIKSFQNELNSDVKQSEEKLKTLMVDIQKLLTSLGELKMAREEFEYELNEIEKEIKRLAKNNLVEPFMGKAVKIFAAASKVIPVGQPALALVGQGLEIVHTAANSKDPAASILKNVPNFLGQIKGQDFKQAGDELSKKLNSLSVTKLAEFTQAPKGETSKERMERLKNDFRKKKDLVDEMIGFYGPIINSVKEQTSLMREREVSKTAMEREIAKIKRKHKLFNKISRALDKLHAKQEETNLLMKKTQTEVLVSFQKITENLLLVSDLYTELGDAANIQSHKLNELLSVFENRAVKNLRFYHYKLAKSFEYKTLSAFKGEFEMDSIFNAVMSLVESGKTDVTSDDLDLAMIAYEDELSRVTEKILDRIERGDRSHSINKKIFLSKAEINALNAGRSIYLDLSSSDHFGEDRENLRIESVSLKPKASGVQGDLEVTIEHDKRSIIESDGASFVFTHTEDNINQHKWVASLNLPTGDVSMSRGAREDMREIEALLGTNISIDKLYANPSARAFYKVSLNKDDAGSLLTELEIDFEINFQFK